MKIVSRIARYLAGAIFVVFGLNGFVHFIPFPPPQGLAAQFMGALFVSHYLTVIMAVQVIAGVLLLVNRFVPLALAVLGAGDRQHSLLPRLHGPEWAAARPFRGAPLVINARRCATCLCQLVSGANERSEQCNLTS